MMEVAGQHETYRVKVEQFEGPLDLLLYLIKKNELDICEVSLAKISDQYLSAIHSMEMLNLDIAGDFILVAATLMLIKSRALLPQEDILEEEDEDLESPAELIRRLLEYKKYKDAAGSLRDLQQLYREVFPRRGRDPIFSQLASEMKEEGGAVEVTLFELMQAFQNILKLIKNRPVHEIRGEPITLGVRIKQIVNKMRTKKDIRFDELFEREDSEVTRDWVIVTFLSMLEMARLSLVRIYQMSTFEKIRLQLRLDEENSEERIARLESLIEASHQSYAYNRGNKEDES